MDSDVINVLVAVVVIFGLVRWWGQPGTPANGNNPAQPSLPFRPKTVTPAMIASVQSAFPQEPRANVHYDLLRTGNAQVTSNTLIEKGSLPQPPPAFFQLYPQPDQPAPESSPASGTAAPALSSSKKGTNLIQRFGLEKEVAAQDANLLDASGKPVWLGAFENSPLSLQERKAHMILTSRQCVLTICKG
ncbi:hypothetical protein DL93DRAFT_2057756 [Clavulina sp. PMI_390]|nr:hypothetical protein DL93DRAFT_2057756 [Clavulina sp. PMI_390]